MMHLFLILLLLWVFWRLLKLYLFRKMHQTPPTQPPNPVQKIDPRKIEDAQFKEIDDKTNPR